MEIPPPPEATRRLLPGHESNPGLPFLIARLLEDGDAADLGWLTGNVPESELASWLESRGGRQLSVRSRAFWELVLDRRAGPEAPARRELWPL